jgi:RNA recognition motif-containing protein
MFVFLKLLCRFAFVDFTSIEHATAALINPKNHHLNGRTLVVEYAGADAVRRGAPKSANSVDREHKGRGGRRPPRANNPRYTTDRPPKQTEERPETEPAVAVEPRQRKSLDGKNRSAKGDDDHGVRHKGPKTRPKPGAALALAKRESVAIVPSQGKKITF